MDYETDFNKSFTKALAHSESASQQNVTAHLLLDTISANNHSNSLPNLLGELAKQQQPINNESHMFAGDPAAPTKLIASLVLFVITLFCGYTPVRMILKQNYIQHAMFAGGGVLMATAFCHLIPEAHDNYKRFMNADDPHLINHHAHQHHEQAQHNNATTITTTTTTTTNQSTSGTTNETMHLEGAHEATRFDVPYLEVTLCCGFFFMYLVEHLMVRFINNHTHEHPCDTGLTSESVPSGNQLSGFGVPSDERALADTRSPEVAVCGPASTAGSTSVGNLSAAAMLPAARSNRTYDLSSSNTGAANTKASEFYKFIRGLLIVSAFGAHSIFDGVAIGSQETPEKVWTIFFAISCHKLIIAAVVGLELFAATLESHLWTLVHLIIFSVMSPIGIILVVVAQSSFSINSSDPKMILLQSFATGTLLYIIFVEILQPKEESVYEKHKLGKSFSLLAGFGLMLVVLTVIGG